MRRSLFGAVAVATAVFTILTGCDSSQSSSGTSTAAPPSTPATHYNSTPATSNAGSAATSPGKSAATATTQTSGSYKPSLPPGSSAVQTGPVNHTLVSQLLVDSTGKEITAPTLASPASPAGNGKATCPAVKIGVLGPLTGSNDAFGLAVSGGAQVAVAAHNKANPGCQVTLVKVDASANPAKAAATLVDDSSVVGLVGPVTTDETIAAGAQFSAAGLPALSPSATGSVLTTRGWKSFFRGVAGSDFQAKALGAYLVNVKNLVKVCVLADSSAYGQGLAQEMRSALGGSLDTACSSTTTPGQADFGALATKIKGESPDGIFYAGYYQQAAGLIKQIRKSGITATFIGSDGVDSAQYISMAGIASAGSIIACPCVTPPAAFAKAYAGAIGSAAGPYSTEAYDLATILLKGIDAGHTDRAELLKYVASYQGNGLAHAYSWDKNGNVLKPVGIWINQVQ